MTTSTKTTSTQATTTKAPTKRSAAKAAAPAPAKTATLAAAAAAGKVRFYRERRNGTMRNLVYLAPGTAERAQAETVAQRRAAGETVQVISDGLKEAISQLVAELVAPEVGEVQAPAPATETTTPRPSASGPSQTVWMYLRVAASRPTSLSAIRLRATERSKRTAAVSLRFLGQLESVCQHLPNMRNSSVHRQGRGHVLDQHLQLLFCRLVRRQPTCWSAPPAATSVRTGSSRLARETSRTAGRQQSAPERLRCPRRDQQEDTTASSSAVPVGREGGAAELKGFAAREVRYRAWD
jgi:hypothetical protein